MEPREGPAESGLTTLGTVLGNATEFDCRHFLYLPMDAVWQLSTQCAIISQSDLNGVPDVARNNGLSYALGIADVQDVVVNAKAQRRNLELEELLQAFLFYYDHDAFIEFGN